MNKRQRKKQHKRFLDETLDPGWFRREHDMGPARWSSLSFHRFYSWQRGYSVAAQRRFECEARRTAERARFAQAMQRFIDAYRDGESPILCLHPSSPVLIGREFKLRNGQVVQYVH